MKLSELKNFIKENILSTLSEDIDDDIQALDDYSAKLDAVIQKKEEAGIEEVEGGNFAELKKYQKMLDDATSFWRKKANEYGVDNKTFAAFNTGINDLVDFVFKANSKRSGRVIDENEDKEPTKADLKKTKGLAKAKEELALLTREMKALARKYSKAKGIEKEQVLLLLKSKTKLKKELENILDK